MLLGSYTYRTLRMSTRECRIRSWDSSASVQAVLSHKKGTLLKIPHPYTEGGCRKAKRGKKAGGEESGWGGGERGRSEVLKIMVRMREQVDSSIYIYAHLQTHMYTCIYTHIYIYKHTHTHTHTHTHLTKKSSARREGVRLECMSRSALQDD